VTPSENVRDAGLPVREVAADVFCVGPWGRTQTVVYFVRAQGTWVLIDAGWAGDAPAIAGAARHLLGTACPAAILLTHCHPDHSGAARPLAAEWGCRVHMHPLELPIAHGDFAAMRATAGPLDHWVILPVMRAIGARRRGEILSRNSIADLTEPLDVSDHPPGLPGWTCVPTPGHTPGHVAYYRAQDRVLISGDALVTLRVNTVRGLVLQRSGLSGPPWYTTWSRQAATSSLRALARLDPAIVAGGHGLPFDGSGLASSLRRLAGLEHS
jgi:glyoxylase-like metal-dependent hydrolase (beta-lactamase superfamily II)